MSSKPSGAMICGMLGWHPAVQAWSAIAPDAAQPDTIEVLRRGRKKAAVYRLRDAAPDGGGPHLIAQRAPLAKALIERTVYRDILPHLPVTAPRLFGFLEDGPEFAWLFLEDVGAERYEPDDPAHRVLGARWLAHMHTTATAVAAARTLPDGGPARYQRHLQTGRRSIGSHLTNPALTADEGETLRGIVASLDRTEGTWGQIEAMCAAVPATLVHGDFRRKNVYLRPGPDGPDILPIDWETAGWGVPAIDLVRIDVPAYVSIAQTTWRDLRLEDVERLAVVGRILSQLAAIDWVSPQLAYEDPLYLVRPMSWLRDFQVQLDDALRQLAVCGKTDLRSAVRHAVTETVGPGAAELCTALDEALPEGEAEGGAISCRRLKSRVYRLSVESRSFVLKRFDPWLARRNELVARRWLPALGLGDRAPSLVAIAPDRSGAWVWHVYEDIGDGAIDASQPHRPSVDAVVELLATLHTRAARHHLLPGCRHICGDLGAAYFGANVRDAIAVLEPLERRPLRDRLLERLHTLRDEYPLRARMLETLGGPDTLLHGDLWTTNTFVAPPSNGGAPTARLIDWDHAAVGPVTYDLSTFLYRFAPADRAWILESYRHAVAPSGWTLPADPELNALFETAEYSRYANRIIWPAVAVLEEGAAWGWEQLEEVERWFDAMTPVLLPV